MIFLGDGGYIIYHLQILFSYNRFFNVKLTNLIILSICHVWCFFILLFASSFFLDLKKGFNELHVRAKLVGVWFWVFVCLFVFLLFCIYSWQSNSGFFKMTNRCYNEYLTLGSNVHQWMHFYHIIALVICSLHHEMETIFNFNFIIWLWSKIVSRYWGMVGLLTVFNIQAASALCDLVDLP